MAVVRFGARVLAPRSSGIASPNAQFCRSMPPLRTSAPRSHPCRRTSTPGGRCGRMHQTPPEPPSRTPIPLGRTDESRTGNLHIVGNTCDAIDIRLVSRATVAETVAKETRRVRPSIRYGSYRSVATTPPDRDPNPNVAVNRSLRPAQKDRSDSVSAAEYHHLPPFIAGLAVRSGPTTAWT